MPTTTPLTDAINALTTYSNTVTGASDQTLSDAVATLAAGYGGGGSSQTVTNVLGNSMSLVTGYLANNGTINTQDSTKKEVTTDYIDISQYNDQSFYWWCKIPGSTTPWVAICYYDENQTLIGSRTVVIDISITSGGAFNTQTTPHEYYGQGLGCFASSKPFTMHSTAKYMRVSFRTLGDGLLALGSASEFTASDYWDRSISELNFINPLISDGSAR